MKSVFHAKEFGKIINFKTAEDARVNITDLLHKQQFAFHSPGSWTVFKADKFYLFLVMFFCFDYFNICD